MMIERLPFWFEDGPPVGATDEAIEAAERHVGHRFPTTLKALLRERDGGVSNYLAYHVDDVYVPLPSMFGTAMVIDAFNSADYFGTPKGILAIGSSGHSWLGLDYRSGIEPRVVYQEDEDGDLETVAQSFDAFLGGLVEEV